MKELGWSLIQELVDDPEEDVAVEGLNLLRNLLHKESAEIELVMCAAGGPEQLLAMLTQKLDPERRCDPRVQREVCCRDTRPPTPPADASDVVTHLPEGGGA